MQRIMQVIYTFAIGGSEIVARDIAMELVRKGWPTAICALEKDGPLRPELDALGVATAVIDRKGRTFIGPAYRLWREFKRFRPDVVHTHHLCDLFFAWPGALLCGARIIHTEHDFHTLEYSRPRLYLRWLSRLCCRVTGVNHETVEYLREKVGVSPGKLETVLNGVAVARFTEKKSIRQELGFNDTHFVVGNVARLEPPKNHHLLLHSFAALAAKFPQVRLLIVGNGSLRTALEDEAMRLGIMPYTYFAGSRRDIPELLASMDLFALSSDFEGMPVAILEAMAARLPVVTTDVGGISDAVRNEVTGFLVEKGSREGFTETLALVLGNPELARKVGAQAHDYVSTHYGLDSTMNSYIRIYANEPIHRNGES